ncbi:universal stress protein [Desulfosporosinus sp. PR]|uniref:universal stress protein n=1 Tax=Candidatus Desulfosporosinus nitrosoreducens TaxID=3401928 RepID=UPI0027F83C21|nr:universal stress protein [Desulfosporosinus sp. PR]MDQ7092397.1 universal stress protein [Desulfosporosinus sp. PR]
MTDKTFKVLLYSDGSQQAFSAAVYTAILLNKMPTMHLTVVQVQESDTDTLNPEINGSDNWPINLASEWKKRVSDEADQATKSQYEQILSQTKGFFKKREEDISFQVIYCNPSISETVEALIDYATQRSFELIIMGTRGLTTLKGLIFGCLAHNLLNKSPIPVLLVKKLPQEFIDNHCHALSNDLTSF